MTEQLPVAAMGVLRGRIADEREKARARIAGLTRDFDAIVAAAEASNADDEHDPEGQTIGFERAQVSALLAETEARLAALDGASARVESGTYGRCARCGGPIAIERLEAAPAAELCVSCAAETERRAGRPGLRRG